MYVDYSSARYLILSCNTNKHFPPGTVWELLWPIAWSIGESKNCTSTVRPQIQIVAAKYFLPIINMMTLNCCTACRVTFHTVCWWVGDAQVAVGPNYFLEIYFLTKCFRATFHTVRRWVGEAREGAGPTSPSLILIGCKLDLVEVKMGDDVYDVSLSLFYK